MEILKVVCLFFALCFGFVNWANAYNKQGVPASNVILWALCTTGFIYLQWLQ